MKKASGILFMLLATVVILAHAFVPHHHHERIVVSVSYETFIDRIFKHHHHHDHSLDHSHSPAKHDHTHDHSHSPANHDHEDEYSEDCLLDDLYLRLKQTKKQQLTAFEDSKSKKFTHVPFLVAAPFQEIEIKDYGELPFRQNPHVPDSFLTHIGRSLSFRGPPES